MDNTRRFGRLIGGSSPPEGKLIYAPLAQLVEQGPLKTKVAGSSPARRTNPLV